LKVLGCFALYNTNTILTNAMHNAENWSALKYWAR